MKKTVALLLSVLFLLSLCACGVLESMELPEPPKLEPTPAPEAAPEAGPQAQDVPQQDITAPEARVIVSISKTELPYYDPADGTVQILDFSYETPRLDISGRDAAADAINEYMAQLDEAYCTGSNYTDGLGCGVNMLLEMATDAFTYAYNNGREMDYILSSVRTVSAKRADSTALSLLYNTYTYTGGAHGSYNYLAFVFDTGTGELVTLEKLISDRPALENIALSCMKEYVEENPDQFFDPSDDALLALLREGSWYLGETGLVIFPQVYEIASYAGGVTFFEIPYAQLDGIIDAKWLPESISGEGDLKLIAQKDFENGSMEVIDKLTADGNGDELCLVAEGAVFDVKVSRVRYAEYNRSFMETSRLWQCNYLRDCVLQLRLLIPEGMPDLMISWRTSGGEEVRRLVARGDSGAAVLISDDISPVG